MDPEKEQEEFARLRKRIDRLHRGEGMALKLSELGLLVAGRTVG